ncbi:MAG: MBL fold metallo-hydrolase [Cohaesibacter sp.]|nr:MBL fold metallo-hydrolase [Cohaesibacter sp.]
MAKAFASSADLGEKTISFDEIGPGLYAFTAQGDPNSGVIVGDDCCMVIDAQATPVAAQEVIKRVRAITDKPIKYVVLTHYHAVRVLGASGYGAEHLIMSDKARSMVVERGVEDWASEFGRMPRLFKEPDSIPGLTWPTLTFKDQMSVYLGKRRVDLMHLGRAHTAGDIVAWVPDSKVMFAGDIVEYKSACYCGDAHFTDWPTTLDNIAAMQPQALVPGRGAALTTTEMCAEGIKLTRDFLVSHYEPVARAAARQAPLKEAFDMCREVCDPKFSDFVIYEHCLPFNVARAYDEASGIDNPRIWTAERDVQMWDDLQLS